MFGEEDVGAQTDEAGSKSTVGDNDEVFVQPVTVG
jgi:hypothetical protein